MRCRSGLLAAALLLVAGCGSVQGATPEPSSTFNLSPDQHRVRAEKVAAIAAEVPPAIRARGTFIVTGDATSSPPLRFYANDDKTMIGVETDIAYLIADTLGLRVDLRSADWGQNFVKTDSGEVDAFISNVTVTEERKEKYDFATYRLDNVTFEVRKSMDWKVQGAKDIAGRAIGVGSGTNQEALLLRWNEENVAAGLPPVDLKYFQQTTGYYLALASGRIDGYVGPNPSVVFHSQATGQTKLVGSFSGSGDTLQGEIAAMVKKDNGLVRPVADAINHVIANGTYRKVLQRWGLENEAVTRSKINPPGMPRQS
jgi:polar amino acid transport system substrate-binding protein